MVWLGMRRRNLDIFIVHHSGWSRIRAAFFLSSSVSCCFGNTYPLHRYLLMCRLHFAHEHLERAALTFRNQQLWDTQAGTRVKCFDFPLTWHVSGSRWSCLPATGETADNLARFQTDSRPLSILIPIPSCGSCFYLLSVFVGFQRRIKTTHMQAARRVRILSRQLDIVCWKFWFVIYVRVTLFYGYTFMPANCNNPFPRALSSSVCCIVPPTTIFCMSSVRHNQLECTSLVTVVDLSPRECVLKSPKKVNYILSI
jgi:hypothetical protein